jgi:hypothetical protein
MLLCLASPVPCDLTMLDGIYWRQGLNMLDLASVALCTVEQVYSEWVIYSSVEKTSPPIIAWSHLMIWCYFTSALVEPFSIFAPDTQGDKCYSRLTGMVTHWDSERVKMYPGCSHFRAVAFFNFKPFRGPNISCWLEYIRVVTNTLPVSI